MTQRIALTIPLSRIDGKPDNGALYVIATIVERGFRCISAEVSELAHGAGIERTLRLVCAPPHRDRARWISALARALQVLSADADIDEARALASA
ncbi:MULTISPECIES: hypothetical protein [unclassified Caballeronia]|uniref:hypothetical protein n=1 Tax=unclassified Caballeronia TaxID=2646786 RepID=UPI00285E2046|nr:MULTISPECIES: hypothetical protein [unclassified Caballeronia]MDR5772140.1 hypothetical protein [Caballeronia sp. LZ002]MDR5804427.1 hypothetical protein [Caballeronia sp. LZ001]MDR5847574.1 hypothetical protein [Caballeronia sp. LZ003]